jgi:hypothetical protein
MPDPDPRDGDAISSDLDLPVRCRIFLHQEISVINLTGYNFCKQLILLP